MALDSRPNPIRMVLIPNTCSKVEMIGILPPRRTANGFLPNAISNPFLSCLTGWECDGAYISLTAMHRCDLYLYTLGSYTGNIFGKQLGYFVMVLMRN